MSKKNFVSLVLVFIGVTFILSFLIIGSEVEKDGVLREPFYLYGTGILFILIGISVFIFSHMISFVLKIIKSKK